MRIKLDENLGSRRVSERIRSAGHDVATAQEQGLSAAIDDHILEVCRREDRCLITLDLGLGDSERYRPSSYAGIVVLRMPARISTVQVDAAISTFVATLKRGDVRGKLWIVQGRRIREHQEE